MKNRATLALLAATLVIPAGAFAHDLTMREAKRAAKRELRGDARYFRSKGYEISGARIVSCEYRSDHMIVCGYKIAIDGDTCDGNYIVRFTSSHKRRIGITQDFFDCGLSR